MKVKGVTQHFRFFRRRRLKVDPEVLAVLRQLRNSGGIVGLCESTVCAIAQDRDHGQTRSEEHTSELQSQSNLVCRLLLEKKKKKKKTNHTHNKKQKQHKKQI